MAAKFCESMCSPVAAPRVQMRRSPGDASAVALIHAPGWRSLETCKLSHHYVFQSKVLQRLYPAAQESSVLQTAVQERSTHAALPAVARTQSIPPKKSGNVKRTAVQGKKLYTVIRPPEGYLITSGDDSFTPSNPDPTDSEDSAADPDDHELHKKRKRRKKKKKVFPITTPEVSTSPAEGVVQGLMDVAHTSDEREIGSTEQISKNKKRKMKKKRHKEKLLALGLMSRAKAFEFTYAQSGDVNSEELLDFLRSTQEIYLSDCKSSESVPCLSLTAAEALFSRLSGRTLAPAEISRLCGLRAVLEKNDLQLKSQLREFKDSSTLPGDEVSVVCMLIEYWLTEILPMQREPKT